MRHRRRIRYDRYRYVSLVVILILQLGITMVFRLAGMWLHIGLTLIASWIAIYLCYHIITTLEIRQRQRDDTYRERTLVDAEA